MELDELKNTWMVLDERLKKNEMLKEAIIKEMLETKTTKSLSKLMNFEIGGIALLLVGIPFVFFILHHQAHFLETHSILRFTFIGAIIICIIACFPQLWKIYALMRIDLSKTINSNIRLIQHYSIYIHWEKIITFVFLAVVFILLAIIYVTGEKVESWRWIFVACGLLFAVIFCVWTNKKLYDAHIQTIKKSLDELKELKEE